MKYLCVGGPWDGREMRQMAGESQFTLSRIDAHKETVEVNGKKVDQTDCQLTRHLYLKTPDDWAYQGVAENE